jgi:hypothetical protein
MLSRSFLGSIGCSGLVVVFLSNVIGCGAADEANGGSGGMAGMSDSPVKDMGAPSTGLEQNGRGDSEVGTSRQALDANWISGPVSWYQNWGPGPATLSPTSTHVCVLTYIKGMFRGGGEQVRVYQSGGTWYLGVNSRQRGIGAAAYCFAKNGFIANGTARWIGGDAVVQQDGVGTSHADAWWGDATTFTNGFAGDTNSVRDFTSIAQSNGAFTPSTAYASVGLSGDFQRNWFISFFAGTPNSGVLAKYWDNATYSASSSTGACSNGGHTEVPMAPVNDAMCHFTYVGNNRNWAESNYVAITPKTIGGIERWTLVAHSQECGSAGAVSYAEARCYKRDQQH